MEYGIARKLIMHRRKISQKDIELVGSIIIFLITIIIQLLSFIKDKIDKLRLSPEEYARKKLLQNQAQLEWIKSQNIHSMTGSQFELYLKKIFENLGFVVQLTAHTGDQGADLIIRNQNEKIAVQVKRYNNNVGNKAVQEVVASVKHYDANRGMVVTNSRFTNAAKELASSNNVELIDGQQLKFLIIKMENKVNSQIKENLKNFSPNKN
jgi:restriction endonuclease Mrr